MLAVKDWLQPLLRCLKSGSRFQLNDLQYDGSEITGNNLINPQGISYSIINGISRFSDNDMLMGLDYNGTDMILLKLTQKIANIMKNVLGRGWF